MENGVTRLDTLIELLMVSNRMGKEDKISTHITYTRNIYQALQDPGKEASML